jgi:hypothetical protein
MPVQPDALDALQFLIPGGIGGNDQHDDHPG